MNAISAPGGINRPPGKIDIPSAWQGAEMKANPDRWLISLGASEIAELENAAESFLGKSKKIAEITRESFRFPVSAGTWKTSRQSFWSVWRLR
ncbi:hypothetical protein [Bradyrhizobium sp. 21]|uniref:hypothetical protein n=1 Tax=Bradyrhizobium sp. 21 TaxID=2782666 RepID=UPI001FF70DA2|nr:hypothetical protein [Bradyrhizobium sp. 21]